MRGAFKEGIEVDLGDGLKVETDSLNTAAKVAVFKGKLFVVFGTDDDFMPKTFANVFLTRRFGVDSGDGVVDRLKRNRSFAIAGGTHNGPHIFQIQEGRRKYMQYLRDEF
jgi:hypothetical protein